MKHKLVKITPEEAYTLSVCGIPVALATSWISVEAADFTWVWEVMYKGELLSTFLTISKSKEKMPWVCLGDPVDEE